jgi:hypothetical protein
MGGSLKYFPTRNLQTVSRQSMCPALESNLRGNKWVRRTLVVEQGDQMS